MNHLFLFRRFYRIQLHPSQVLELIQASAEQEHFRWLYQSTRTIRSYAGSFVASKRGDGPNWRDARYQEILDRTCPDRSPYVKNLGENISNLIANLRGMFSYTGGGSKEHHSTSKMFSEVSVIRPKLEECKDLESALAMGRAESDVVATLQRAPPSMTGDTWAWVEEHDELIQAMREGAALFGFVEAPITFPPSFRWNENKSAGNFTGLPELEGKLRWLN